MSYGTPLEGETGVTLSIANGESTFTVSGVLLNAGDPILPLDFLAADNRTVYIKTIDTDGLGGTIYGTWQGADLVDSEAWMIVRSAPPRLDALEAAVTTRDANERIKLWGDRAPPYKIKDILAAPPGSPAEGDRYIVDASPSGAWVGHDNDIATWSSGEWNYTDPVYLDTANIGGDQEQVFFWNDIIWKQLGDQGPGYFSTSSTNTVPLADTGSIVLSVQPGLAYAPGVRIRASDQANPLTKYMEGVVTAYSGTSLTFTADRKLGAGTPASWYVNLAGDVGGTGPPGTTGPAGPGYKGTSTTNLSVTAASKAFTTQAGLGWSAGQRARATSAADATKWMEGVVTAYAGTTLTVLMDLLGPGAGGSAADWNINLTGEPGDTGDPGADSTVPGPTGSPGISPAPNYTFSTTITDADPGDGKLRFNHATFASITSLFIDNKEKGGTDITPFLDTLDDSTSATRGYLYLVNVADATIFAIFRVTGSVVDGGGYRKLTVVPLAGAVPANNAVIAVNFQRTGDAGSGFGDILAANDATDFSHPYKVLYNIQQRGANVTAAASINLTDTDGWVHYVDGNTNIGAITLPDGKRKRLIFNGTPTLIPSASFILNGNGANVVIAAGDILDVTGLESGKVKGEVTRMNGRSVVSDDISSLIRTKLTGNRNYYVRTVPAAVTLTLASPGTVNWTGHPLVANSPVLLTILKNRRTFTVTIASPGVFTAAAHGFIAGQPLKFYTSGALPTGLTQGTTYYVLAAGLTTDTFQVGATAGGAAINTTGSQSGTHYLDEVGTLPTGLVEGTVYFVVGSSITANSFQVSATAGGAAINFTGSQEGKIKAQTGNDNNIGLLQTPTGAFLTLQAAVNAVAALDVSIYDVQINVADGKYIENLILKNFLGAGLATIYGSSSAIHDSASGNTVFVSGIISRWKFDGGLSARSVGASYIYAEKNSFITWGNLTWGATTSVHVLIADGSTGYNDGSDMIDGNFGYHEYASYSGQIIHNGGITTTIIGNPTITQLYATAPTAGFIRAWNTIVGNATGGKKFFIDGGSIIDTAGTLNFFPGTAPGTIGNGGGAYLGTATVGFVPQKRILTLAADQTGTNVNTAQPWFPGGGATGITLPVGSYRFRGYLALTRSAGAVSHTIGLLFAGTVTLSSIEYVASSTVTDALATPSRTRVKVATNTAVTAANASATESNIIEIAGIVRVSAVGTFIPQFIYSAAPGGAPTVGKNIFFEIFPFDPASASTLSVGDWS